MVQTNIDEALVRAHCAEIGAAAASTNTKMSSTNLVTYAKARYKAMLSSWSLRDLEDIDKMFYSFPTKATKICEHSHTTYCISIKNEAESAYYASRTLLASTS